MNFGIANNVRSEVRECTPELLNQALDSPQVAKTCAEIEDALEALQRGELTQDEFETLKSTLKKRLPILTLHATFKNGRRKNEDAIPSGLAIYDLDHIPNPRAKWAEIESRKEELNVLLAHVTPSSEGLRLAFIVPSGMDLAQAQAWMARELGDDKYDACVKDYARCSFLVPREYVLWLDEERLFTSGIPTPSPLRGTPSKTEGELSDSKANQSSTVPSHLQCEVSEAGICNPQHPQESSRITNADTPDIRIANADEHYEHYPSTYEEIPYETIVEVPPKTGGELSDSKANQSSTVPSHLQCEVSEAGICNPQHPQESSRITNADTPDIRITNADEHYEHYPQTYEEIPYEQIVETLEEQMGGQPEHGSRNNFIFSMACHLRYITNDDANWIAQILPTYGEAKDKWMATIRSACARSQTKRMPKIMQRTLAICKERMETEEQAVDPQSPPPMPVRLPPLIKLLVSKTPKIYRPAVAHAVFPALAAHLWKTTFRYIDNVEHEATLMNVLMAGTGAGKNCISDPINHILKDIRQRDRDNLQREKEWKKEMQTKGANKDKRQRPEGLVIQEIDPDMTNAAFVQRLADAEERFLYARMNEIDQFDALKTSARSKAHFQIMCLAFDPGNVYGQTRVGTGSVSERVCIRFNWNASTTIHKGQAYFRSVLTDGPISRINFCTIPEQPIGADMPVYGTYDAEFDEELRPYIERLNKARGLVECRGARLLAKKLKEENAEFARLSQSRVYENLSFRANVIAYLKAMVLFVAQGGVWDKVTEDFIRWSLKYDMYCKMKFFGDAIEDMETNASHIKRRGPQNLLDLLPDIFTRDEAGQMRHRQGVVNGSLGNMLATWKKRKYIEPYGEEMTSDKSGQQQFIKTAAYLKSR